MHIISHHATLLLLQNLILHKHAGVAMLRSIDRLSTVMQAETISP